MSLNQFEYKHLVEVVNDGMESAKLNEWEQTFLGSIYRGLNTYGADFDISSKQLNVMERIEQKVYAHG